MSKLRIGEIWRDLDTPGRYVRIVRGGVEWWLESNPEEIHFVKSAKLPQPENGFSLVAEQSEGAS